MGGVFDLVPLLKTSIVAPLQLELAEAHPNSPLNPANIEIIRRNSDDMKIFLYHGEFEAPGLIEQNRRFYQVLMNMKQAIRVKIK